MALRVLLILGAAGHAAATGTITFGEIIELRASREADSNASTGVIQFGDSEDALKLSGDGAAQTFTCSGKVQAKDFECTDGSPVGVCAQNAELREQVARLTSQVQYLLHTVGCSNNPALCTAASIGTSAVEAPQNVTAVPTSTPNQLVVTWVVVPSIRTISVSVNGHVSASCTDAAEPCVLDGLTAGVASLLVVTSHSAGGSANAPAIVATPLSWPGAPTILSVHYNVAAGSAVCTFEAALGGMPVDEYTLSWRDLSGVANNGTVHAATPTTNITISNLLGGHRYAFTLTAHNLVGASVPSARHASSLLVGSEVPPTLVQNLTGTSNNGSGAVLLTWQPPADDGGSPVLHYKVG